MSNRMSLKDFRKKGCVSEKEEQKMCMQFLSVHPKVEAWRVNTGQAKYENKDGSTRYVNYGKKGHPDIAGYIKKTGRTFFWEAKSAKGKLRPDQKIFIENVLKDGCLAGYGTCEDLINYIRSIDI